MSPLRWLARTHALGLSVSVGITLALFTWLFDGAERDQRSGFEQRLLLLQANTLAKLVEPARPDDLNRLLGEWQARNPRYESAVLVAGMELLASTRAEDAAPRRLMREEKPLYDLANLIRTARETNVSEQVVRKKLMQIDRLGGERYAVTVPYLVNDEFVGILQIRIRNPYAMATDQPSRGSAALWLPLLLGALGLGALLRTRSDKRLDIPRVAALAFFLSLTLFYQSQRMDDYVQADLAGTHKVAQAVQEAVKNYGLPPTGANAISPWDTDRKSTRLNSSHNSESRMPSSA
jgi:arabinogalactan oligomer/maltooligosaccharide transport system permease protein